jgi:hypothetical protein
MHYEEHKKCFFFIACIKQRRAETNSRQRKNTLAGRSYAQDRKMTSNKMNPVSQAYGSILHIMARRKGYFDSYNHPRACYLPFERDLIKQQDDFLSV